MYIVDMHCDSLLTVSGERGLVNEYNFSSKYPHLHFVPNFCPNKNRAPVERRAQVIRALDTYLWECDRLKLRRVLSGRDLFGLEAGDVSRSVLLSLEGGGGLFADSTELSVLRDAGLLVFGPAWDNNELSASAFDDIDTGLTEKGRAIIDKCSEIGIIIDVSHMSDKAFYETFEISPMPHLATHSNFRDVCSAQRNLTSDMARKIALRGGVIGINLYPEFLSDSGDADTEDIIRHIDYGLELLGEDYIGFGFDIDGTSGKYPRGISPDSSIHDQVVDLLLSRYSASVVEKIAGKNVIEFLKNNII